MTAIDAGTLATVAGDVFAGVFGEDDGRPYPDEHGATLPVTASVRISGACECVVVVAVCHELLTDAAARLFGIAAGDVTDVDRHDLAGELANIVGGNVKSMLPGPTVLSLPTVRPGDATACDVVGPAVDLVWRRRPLRIHLTVPTP